MKKVFDELFDLKYYGNFSIFESYNLPLGLREYYVNRLIDTMKKEQDAIEKAKGKRSQ